MSAPPFHDRDGFIWMNGEMVAWRAAQVHVLTHALHYGGSVFEGERAYGGRVFKGREHTARLQRSAMMMGYALPFSGDEIEAAKDALIRKMGFSDCYIRAIAWRGSDMMGVAAQANRIHLAIAMWEWGDYFKTKREGIRLAMARWRRPSPDTAPCTAKASGLYMICTMSKHQAENEGYADALMLDYRGQVAEATGANVFFVKDGTLLTPTPDCFLDGITRRTVIALAKARGIPVVERAIFPPELYLFDECFLAGTAAEITPVAEIAGIRYQTGPMTFPLMDDFARLVRAPAAAISAA